MCQPAALSHKARLGDPTMFYEINVSKSGQHYFATSDRSILCMDKAIMMVRQFRVLFPADQGYEIILFERAVSDRRVAVEA